MSLLSVPKLDVLPVRYGDLVHIPVASGYNFTTPGNTHGLGIVRVNPAHAVNPGFLEMTEGPADEFDLVAGFDSEFFIDGNPDFVTLLGDSVLYIDPATFPVQDEFYLLGIFDLSAGPTTRHLVDLKLLFVEKETLDIFDSTTAAVDEETLDAALGLAGHNSKMRAANYIEGQLADFEIAIFNAALTLPLVEADLDSDIGLEKLIAAQHITDNLGDVKSSLTARTL